MRRQIFSILFGLLLAACAPASHVNEATLSPAASLSASCSGCHVAGSAVPSFDDWSQTDLQNSLTHYQDKTTGDSAMHRFARGLSEDDIAQISAFLGIKS